MVAKTTDLAVVDASKHDETVAERREGVPVAASRDHAVPRQAMPREAGQVQNVRVVEEGVLRHLHDPSSTTFTLLPHSRRLESSMRVRLQVLSASEILTSRRLEQMLCSSEYFTKYNKGR